MLFVDELTFSHSLAKGNFLDKLHINHTHCSYSSNNKACAQGHARSWDSHAMHELKKLIT